MADIKYLMDNFEKYLEKKREHYEEEKKQEKEDMLVKAMTWVISWLTFAIAAMLSWECNSRSKPNMMIAEKVTRALISGYFGLFYILLYFIFWSGNCNKAVVPTPTALKAILDETKV